MSLNSTSAGTINNVIRTQNYKRVFLQLESAKAQLDQAQREKQDALNKADEAKAKAVAFDLVNDTTSGASAPFNTSIKVLVKQLNASTTATSAQFVNHVAGHPDQCSVSITGVNIAAGTTSGKFKVTFTLDGNHQYVLDSGTAQNLETLEFDDVEIVTSPATPVANKSDTLKTTTFTAATGDTITLKDNTAAQIKYSGPATDLARSLGSIVGGKFDTILSIAIESNALYVGAGIDANKPLVCEVIPAVYVASNSS